MLSLNDLLTPKTEEDPQNLVQQYSSLTEMWHLFLSNITELAKFYQHLEII